MWGKPAQKTCLVLIFSQEPSFGHDDALKQVDCIMTVVGVDEDILYSKSHALQVT